MKLPRLIPSINPPFDESCKARVEAELGLLFPSAMIELLRTWNGGYFDGVHEIAIPMPFPDSLIYYLQDGYWPIEGLPGFANGAKFSFNIEACISCGREWELPRNVIPLCGDGHTWIALDYRNIACAEPSVIFIETSTYQSHRLADDFSSFVGALVPENTVT